LNRDVRATPAAVMRELQTLFEYSEVAPGDLVPTDRRYYERLVGRWEQHRTLAEFAAATAGWGYGSSMTEQIEQGLARSIHASTAPGALIAACDPAVLRTVVTQLLPHIDAWSLTGLSEGLVQRPDAFTELKDVSEQVLRTLLEITGEDHPRLRLTASLAALVDGTNSVSGRFGDRPVYWRRLASFAHAALLERLLLQLGIPVSKFVAWADNFRPTFQVATLADLPSEPRWHSLLLTAPQLRAELLGRAWAALAPHRERIVAAGLDDLVFAPAEHALETRQVFILSVLPGPLEGEVSLAMLLQPELQAEIEEYELVSELTRLLQQLDDEVATPERWPDLLMMLAYVAAGARDRPLADAVHQHLARRTGIAFDTRVYVTLSACGWCADLEAWTTAIAEAANTLVRDLTPKNARHLEFVLDKLANAQPLLIPRLAPVVARVRGALMARRP
jgi:hypothetical protein